MADYSPATSAYTSTPPPPELAQPGLTTPLSEEDNMKPLWSSSSSTTETESAATTASDAAAAQFEYDGDMDRDIAICGFSLKFPQEATTPAAFWKMICKRRCAMTDFPADRLNLEGFYRAKDRINTLPLKGGHFIQEDLAVFDAEFFGISPTEAAAMDPMQRWLLETAYRALENAGIPMESVSGSQTAVYTGSFGLDYMLQLTRDPETPPTYAAVGFGLSMLANRLSWFFNFRGPSVGLDSACSSTAMAIDIACQGLANGSSNMALVAGSNITSAPESYTWMSNLGFLSPDSKCHSFDHRANGYARGEGIGVIILKRVSDAIRDGNTIRAVIRATGSGEDGHTPGITQPSRQAQEDLIRITYQKAGLSMEPTRFFEAHGTGTAIGDPREAQAIGSAFRKFRSTRDPLYVGALKSNIGHLEGASALAGVIKTVLALEKGVIPPNTNFEKINPKIDAEFLRLKFPQTCHPWPSQGLRRASINSFGYGGANAHIVLDDAYNYLRLRSLRGKHLTAPVLPLSSSLQSMTNGTIQSTLAVPLDEESSSTSVYQTQLPKLLVWSAADKDGIRRIASAYQNWENLHIIAQDPHFLDNLAYTLDTHRSSLPWRSFALINSPNDLTKLQDLISTPVRAVSSESSSPPRLGFVFTGQGAQWADMGRELVCYASYTAELEDAQNYLASLGCGWSLMDELTGVAGKETSNIDRPGYSQVLCTVLQVALVNLLERFGVRPSAVVGHSSGEIAAAYAGGYISRESAWKLAYFRGLCAGELAEANDKKPSSTHGKGAMMSVGLSEEAANALITPINNQPDSGFGVSIACVNSPTNVTLSGEEHLIDILQAQLTEKKVFARKLRVPLAYHSRQMQTITARFLDLIGSLSSRQKMGHRNSVITVPMLSTVTGERITPERLLDPTYWTLNLISPVRFSSALVTMCSKSRAALTKKLDKSHEFASVVDHLIEVGPHATLQGPIRDTLRMIPRGQGIGYTSLLRRGQSAMDTVLSATGTLYSLGVAIRLRKINETSSSDEKFDESGSKHGRSLLVDLPEYPFDHSQRYWHESRISQGYRLRSHAPSALLGVRSSDWDPAEPRWRHFIRPAEMPWVTEHVVNGSTLYPGTGMLVMAIEAAKQMTMDLQASVNASAPLQLDGYTLRKVNITNPINITAAASTTVEVQTSLREISSGEEKEKTFEFTVKSHMDSNRGWQVNCQGLITVRLSKPDPPHRQKAATNLSKSISNCTRSVKSDQMYRFLKQYGYEYGPTFQSHNLRYNPEAKQAAAEVTLVDADLDEEEPHVVHPASLDTILHLAFAALTKGGSEPMATSVPSHIDSIWISDRGLSNSNSQSNDDKATVTAYSSIESVTKHGFTCTSAAVDSTSGNLRVWAEGLQLTNVTSVPSMLPVLPNPKQFCMHIDLKPDLSKLSPREICSLLQELNPIHDDGPTKAAEESFFRDLEHLIAATIKNLVDSIPAPQSQDSHTDGQDSPQAWRQRYHHWAKHHLAAQTWKHTPESDETHTLQELSTRVKNFNNVGNLYATVAAHLISMFNNQAGANPLELLMQSGLLRSYYEELATYRCSRLATSYLDLLAHQNPGMNILEVGGGTASATRTLIPALVHHSTSKNKSNLKTLKCNHYTFTDVSAAFLDAAREEFSPHQNQMTFTTLDVELDIHAQPHKATQEKEMITPHSQDLVIADGVLHITTDMAQTLRNIRRLLRPGGKLLLREILEPTGWTVGFVFGVFPGWWKGGAHDGRVLSPNLDVDAWDSLLKKCGFSGVELVLRDEGVAGEMSHWLGWIVATAVDSDVDQSPERSLSGQLENEQVDQQRHDIVEREAIIIVDDDLGGDDRQQVLGQELAAGLSEKLQLGKVRVLGLQEASDTCGTASTSPGDELVIFLVDYMSSPLLTRLNNHKWTQLQILLTRYHHILWVSSGGGLDSSDPGHAMVDGLARTLRSEYYELHMVTLALDPSLNDNSKDGMLAAKHITLVVKIAREILAREPHQPYEQEYIEIDGLLHTRRLVEAQSLKEQMDARLVSHHPVMRPLDGTARWKPSVAPISSSTSRATSSNSTAVPHLIECNPANESLESLQIEIGVKAVFLDHSDRAIILGQTIDHLDTDPPLGRYCSGIVTQAGKSAGMIFRPGDHVVAAANGDAFQSHVRVPVSAVAKFDPLEMSFSTACREMASAITAYHAIVESCPIQSHESVLVCNGADSSLGQAVIKLLATTRGVKDIWVTTSDTREPAATSRLISQFAGVEIPDNRVLPRAWFDGGDPGPLVGIPKFDSIILCTSRDGNTSSSPLILSQVRSGGRVIMFGSDSSASEKSNKNVASMKRLASIFGDISVSVLPSSAVPTSESLRYATNILSFAHHNVDQKRQQQVVSSTFPISDLAKAVSHLRGADREGVIITLDDVDEVELNVPTRPKCKLDPNSTYLIAGGFGGIGRALVRWLVARGARYLIILSRSGPHGSPESQRLMAELNNNPDNIHVEAPICDVADAKALQALLNPTYLSSRGMPPIKGCIQTSMVMTEQIFPNTTFPLFQSTIAPKVAGSWNLHSILPRDLDFFVMISSMMGITGGGSLSGYNAGNTYQDALARYRVSREKQPAFSVDLGAVPDEGYLVDHESHRHHLPGMATKNKYALTYTKELCALLDVYCDPSSGLSSGVRTCQAVIGVRPVSHWARLEEVPATMNQPFWGHMRHVPPLFGGNGDEEESQNGAGVTGANVVGGMVDAGALLSRVRAAGTLVEAAQMASEALACRLSALLGTAWDRLDDEKPMYSYGIDSLSAIEIRNWVAKVFGVDLPVFEILGGATLATAGMAVVRRIGVWNRVKE